MTKTLTEQWRDGTLPSGEYYIKLDDGSFTTDKYFGKSCGFAEEIPVEVLGPAPNYMDCKGLIYDSINLADARERIDELVSKNDKLQKQLEIATKALEDITLASNMPSRVYMFSRLQQALKEMEGVK